jgi:hypothetical protein
MEDFEGETQKGLWFYGTRNWLKDLVCFERPRVNGPAKDLCSNEYIYIYIIYYIYMHLIDIQVRVQNLPTN